MSEERRITFKLPDELKNLAPDSELQEPLLYKRTSTANYGADVSRLSLERRLSLNNQGLNMSIVERKKGEIAIGLQGQIEILPSAGYNPNILNIPEDS